MGKPRLPALFAWVDIVSFSALEVKKIHNQTAHSLFKYDYSPKLFLSILTIQILWDG